MEVWRPMHLSKVENMASAGRLPRPGEFLAIRAEYPTAMRRSLPITLLLLGCLWMGSGGLGAQPPGYSIVDNQIRVETAEHWQSWTVAVGAASITPEGTVSPRFLRKRVNAALDAPKFGTDPPGGAVAGSNLEAARFILDGDPNTFWGPDLDDSARDWWIQLRLGRVVVVDSVVLRFAEEDQGDPFLQFDVMGWRRPPPLAPSKYNITGTGISALWVIYRTDRPNRSERRISFVPRTTEPANTEFEGDPLDVIHILLTDSDVDRRRQVGEQTYANLPADARGAIDHYRLSGSGRQTLTRAEAYANLPPERQGAVRYYRRERPRLAEVEVWTAGDNLNLGLVSAGARATLQTERSNQAQDLSTLVTDGDFSTGPSSPLFSREYITFFEDLGTIFWVDTIDFLTDYLGNAIYEFDVDVSDGSLAPDGSVLWSPVARERVSARFRSFDIGPTRVRYLRTRFRTRSGTAQISMMEALLYGEGYVAEAHLASDVIDLGGRKGLVTIEWEADTPEGTKLEISTRTGNTLSQRTIFRDSDGREVTEDRYRRRLPEVKKGEVTSYYEPGEEFSDWSLPYTRSGEEIRSPRTRRYLQVQVRVLADTTSKLGPPASLHSLRINLADLYTDNVTGEVWPTRVERIGEAEPRSYFLHPVFGSDDRGFDEIRVVATAATFLDVVEVRAGTRQDFLDGAERIIPAQAIVRAPTGRDTLVMRLPVMLRPGVELVEVRMETTVHGNSAAFEAAVKEAAYGGAWQLAEVGDATPMVNSETNVVVALADNRVLSELRIEPVVFTPNGDGVNDATTFSFGFSRVTGPKQLALSVYDLRGRRVRHLPRTRPDPRGSWTIPWAGDDDGGRPVPPGIYVVRLEVDAESDRAENTQRTGIVHVAY
jgi:hypothetical protein